MRERRKSSNVREKEGMEELKLVKCKRERERTKGWKKVTENIEKESEN